MRSGGGLVTFSFDDGRLSAVTRGAEVLERYGMRGTFYIITDVIETENEHGKYADWNDIARLHTIGHEIGNHSHTHQKELKDWSSEMQRADILKATDVLGERGIVATTFAYPFGYVSDSLERTISDLGFVGSRTTEPGINTPETHPLCLKSFVVEDRHTLSDVSQEVEHAMQQNGWLILCFHHIDDKTYLSTPPRIFEEMVHFIHTSDVMVVTTAEGIRSCQA